MRFSPQEESYLRGFWRGRKSHVEIVMIPIISALARLSFFLRLVFGTPEASCCPCVLAKSATVEDFFFCIDEPVSSNPSCVVLQKGQIVGIFHFCLGLLLLKTVQSVLQIKWFFWKNRTNKRGGILHLGSWSLFGFCTKSQ